MPMLSTNPKVLKLAVKRAVPAKTSNAKTGLICRPTAGWPLVKLASSQRCAMKKESRALPRKIISNEIGFTRPIFSS